MFGMLLVLVPAGHVMQDSVITPRGIRFERATIQVWLDQQGQVCPISHKPLSAGMQLWQAHLLRAFNALRLNECSTYALHT